MAQAAGLGDAWWCCEDEPAASRRGLEFGHLSEGFPRVEMIVRSFCPRGTVESSPPFQGWGSSEDVLSPEGTAESLPQIPLVVLDLVFLQQRDKLLLKTDLPVMHFLVPEVRDDFVQLRIARQFTAGLFSNLPPGDTPSCVRPV